MSRTGVRNLTRVTNHSVLLNLVIIIGFSTHTYSHEVKAMMKREHVEGYTGLAS